ncbi:hypothetical protein [Paenibacillus paeoniae]|uniref:REase associating with pPIWI RE domain-containing protein n=1 Tax=Paenibacillus paeoniae TaxID=2292705 RepID=A0A371PJH0_9BACL|nr:hypothetical protein [Paenibacillus paeoniae]REK76075.1 hypothetical protein DX130_03140 [Paenibacillus paeoniae]
MSNDLSLQSSFLALVKQCIDLESWIDAHNADPRTRLHHEFMHNFSASCKSFIKEAYENEHYTPSTEFALIGFLKKPVTELGSDAISQLVSGAPLPVIDPSNNRVHPIWYELLKEREAYDSEGAIRYSQLMKCIIGLPVAISYKVHHAFIALRDILSSSDRPMIWEVHEVEDMLEPFQQIAGVADNLRFLFTPIPSHHQEITLCPHCGGSMNYSQDTYHCIHWRCQHNIDVFRINKEPFQQIIRGKTRYLTLSNYAHRYIRIPGIEERRIASQINLEEEMISLQLNPDFDRVDLLYEMDGEPFIQADIKDYLNPFILGEDLAQQNFLRKKGELEKTYIVVPSDTIRQSGHTDYIRIVQQILSPDILEHLEIVSEYKWYQVVRNSLALWVSRG